MKMTYQNASDKGCTFFGSLGCPTTNTIVLICCHIAQVAKASKASFAGVSVRVN
jgi:hypothetical protein